MSTGGTDHNAHGQYHLWSGSQDHYDDGEIERLQAVHGGETVVGVCEGCGKTVHTGAKGYNEQVHSYVRYGPYFVCSVCILDAVDLPEIPWGGPRYEQTDTEQEVSDDE